MTKFMHVKRTNLTLPTQNNNVRRFSFQDKTYSTDDCCKRLPPTATSIYTFSYTQPSVQLEVFSRFNLLKVLMAISPGHESFKSFPLIITKLYHLRYLAIRCSVNLPASISELQNLQTLIIHRSNNSPDLYLPGNIWIMRNLRLMHLGYNSCLPSPSILNHVTEMPNLVELSVLSCTSCTNEVFSHITKIKRLTIRVLYSPTDRLGKYLIDMSSLRKLEALKCFSYGRFGQYWSQLSMKRFVFPTSLKRLTFSDCTFPWEDISTLVMLPNLEELKLKFAVRGGVWRLSNEDKFKSLKLLISLSDIEHWEASSDSFPNLKHLVLKYCDYLEEIPIDFGEICTLESIDLHECGTAAEDSARKIEQEQEDLGNNFLKVYIHSKRKAVNWSTYDHQGLYI